MKQQHPQLPWQQIIGLRNVVIHQYDAVDLDIVWKTIREDLPTLIAQLEPVVDEGSSVD